MNTQRWIARREASWQALETLLRQAEQQGVRSLSAAELQSFASLYRSVSADLARARTYAVGELLTQRLQNLASRSYSQIYQGSRRQEWQALLEFCRWGFPAVVQQSIGYILLASGLGLGAGLLSWWLAWQDPTFMALAVPPELISQVRDRQELWMGSILGWEPLASSGIMINNLRVSFTAAAGGITAGLLTLFLMVFNGIHIGAIAALVSQNNLGYPFWAFVFPHGALEIPAIFFSGAAGFLIARALLFPGRYARIDALKHYGNQAAQLLFGVVPMLVVAGTIEGFFSPNPAVPDSLKYLTGLVIFVALVAYLSQKRSAGGSQPAIDRPAKT